MFSLLASSCVQAHEHELGCSRCFQRTIWEQASDWLNSFGDGGEETEKMVDQLGFASIGLLNRSSFTLYISLWDVYDTVLINILQVNPKPFVCWTARFKRDLCSWRAKLREWKMLTEFYLISQAAGQCAWHLVCTVRGSQLMRGTHCTKTGHNTLLLPSGHFETEKWWLNFCLISQAARRCTRHSECTVRGSELMRGS